MEEIVRARDLKIVSIDSPRLRGLLLLLASIFSLPMSLGCSMGKDSPNREGVIVMAHGGTASWNEAVEAAVDPLSLIVPTEIAYGMADRQSLQNSVGKLEAKGVNRIAVVRLFVSGDSFLGQTEYFLGLRSDPPPFFLIHKHDGDMATAFADRSSQHAPRIVSSLENLIPPIETKSEIGLSRAGLYDSEEIGRIIVERVQSLSRDPSKESVLILAHGEGEDRLNQRWLHRLESLTAKINAIGNFRSIQVETLREDWVEKRKISEKHIRMFVEEVQKDHGEVLVVPFRVFGFGPYAAVLRNLPYRSDGLGLLPHKGVTRWLEREVSRVFQNHHWEDPFFSKLEGADHH
jgi:sirohydrochlorin cobaltochelatase